MRDPRRSFMLNGSFSRDQHTLVALGLPTTAVSEPLQTAFGSLSPTFLPKDLSSDRLAAILDRLEDAVLLVDALEQPLYVNQAVFRLLGINPAFETLEVWAADCGARLATRDRPFPWADFPLSRVLRGESGDPVELRLLSPRLPHVTWLRASASPLKGEEDDILGAMVVLRDITAQKRYETELRTSNQEFQSQARRLSDALTALQKTQSQLIQTEKMSSLGQVVAGVAHEINNPVSFIHGNLVHIDAYIHDLLGLMDAYQQHLPTIPPALEDYLEAIDLPFVREDLPRLVASMRMGTERIREIVLSLRNFSRLDESDLKVVDLHEGIESTLTILGSRLRGKANEATIRVVKAFSDLPTVECYPGPLNQVYMNILTNAIEALAVQRRSHLAPQSAEELQQPHPTITIRTEIPKPDWVRIEIANNGPAIPEAVQRRIFDPFFTTHPVGKNKGMGMAIAYQIVVDQHGGSLKCLSQPGEGVAFRLDLPVTQQANHCPRESPTRRG